MSKTIGPGFSLIQSVLHPTDFSEGSLVAFHHALKTAMQPRSRLTLLHVSSDKNVEWSDFPGVRETLERWGALPKGSEKSAVATLGIYAGKVVANEGEPVEAVIRHLEHHSTDLIVLSTSQREGHLRWLGKSVSAPMTRKSGEMTLLIPGDAKGFVSAEDGSVNLNKILIPVARTPRPEAALNSAALLVERMQAPEGTFIVLSTDGRNGFLDGLRGSHSERVLRYGAAPLLTVPVGSRMSRHLA